MQFTTVLVALLAGAVSAAPAVIPAEVEKRACQFVAPAPLGVNVSKNAPQWVGFSVPAGAVGACQLEAYFPAGFPITGTSQVNVYDVNGPVAGSLVGTITFQSDPREATRRYINSFACRTQMDYRLEIAGESGHVSWNPTPGAGLRMSYGC